ncbi:gliding motility protein GldL [Flavobacterium sp.]|uniref:GldL-related protein n=1 Tax=Flavobacterium sp. TaxID=239 RepID=UPI00375389A2
MKNKYIIIILIFGFLIAILGSLFKITHWQLGFVTGSLLLTIGMCTEIIAGILFIIKLLLNKNNTFLNK